MTEDCYTKLPNAWIDVAMQRMGYAEMKIVFAVLRQTTGWHKPHDVISLSQFEAMTGMTRANVIKGIRDAAAHQWIRHYKRGNVSVYEPSLDAGIAAIPGDASIAAIPEMVLQQYPSSIAAIPEVVSQQYTQKKPKKETKKGKENLSGDATRADESPAKRSRAKLSEAESARHKELFEAIANVCVMDAKLSGGQIARTAKQLRDADASASAQRLREFLEWWKRNDFRGRQGKPPTPGQLLASWRQFGEGFAEIPKPAYDARPTARGIELNDMVGMFGDLIKEKNHNGNE
jgi:phage replication O-like protein O